MELHLKMVHFLLSILNTGTGRGKGFNNSIPSAFHQCDKVLHTWHFGMTGKDMLRMQASYRRDEEGKEG
jgi:hypothetical protein